MDARIRAMQIEEFNKENYGFPLWKLQYKGIGLLTNDLVEKSKLLGNVEYCMIRKEKFLMNLRR